MNKFKTKELMIDYSKEWEEEWKDMPEFYSEDKSSYKKIIVHFRSKEDIAKFGKSINRKLTENTRSIWFPDIDIERYMDKRYINKTNKNNNPIYPVYIISKGRWESRLTSKSLDMMKVPYRIVIEPQEYEEYSKVIDKDKILVLPFSDLGQGSIPARNWVWEHSISKGHQKHWIMDDNIEFFFRFNYNLKVPVADGTILRTMEIFSDRYKDIALSGPNYFMFASRKDIYPAYYLNTRIYSCILIDNKIPFRWRGRYNEDTDLSLCCLKAGYRTVLFNTFLIGKKKTMTMKGGNTDELYQDDGRLKMAEALVEQHPDCVRIVRKWGRWQHHVDYSSFRKNRLIRKDKIKISNNINNYGMILENKSIKENKDIEDIV